MQGGRSFRVPLGGYSAGAPAFHDVAYHSGDPFDGTNWGANIGGTDFIEWTVSETWNENPDANALRWGTAYTFRFVAGSPPREGQVVVGLFGPGTESEVTMGARVPACRGDANGDEVIDFNDVTWVLSAWNTAGPQGDADHDGDVDFGDVSAILARFGAGC